MTATRRRSRLDAAAAVAWRLLVVAAAIALVAYLLVKLRLVVLPVIGALLLATFLEPPARWLRARGVPAALAALGVLAGWLVLLAAVFTAIAPSVISELDDLDVNLRGGINTVEDWLSEGPLGLSADQVDRAGDRIVEELRSHAGEIGRGAVSGAVLLVEVLAGALLTVVLAFFLLKDGDRVWRWLLGLFPRERREGVDEASRRAWGALGGYVRGITLTALFEGALVAVILLVLGVPLALPLAVLTFFGAFIPIVGAFAAGIAATLVALFAEGFGTALIVLAAFVAIQQLEGNVLQPLIVGAAVEMHPIAILLAVTAGGVTAGIVGAFLAVPAVAVANSVLGYVREREPGAGPEPGAPG